MKRIFVTGIIATCLSLFGLCAVPAQDAHRFAVDIPFPFVLDGQALSAGRYELGRIDRAKPNVLLVKNVDAGMRWLLLTQRAEKETPSTETYLLFKRLGGRLYLSEIWTRGSMNGIRIRSIGGQESRQESSDSGLTVRLNLKRP